MSGAALRVTRPFNWGIVIIGDPASIDLPEVPQGGAIGVGRFGVVVAVRHAQDSDDGEPFAVEVACHTGPAPGASTTTRVVINVLSGKLGVGDADAEEILDVPAGERTLEFALEPGLHAERVDVWVS